MYGLKNTNKTQFLTWAAQKEGTKWPVTVIVTGC